MLFKLMLVTATVIFLRMFSQFISKLDVVQSGLWEQCPQVYNLLEYIIQSMEAKLSILQTEVQFRICVAMGRHPRLGADSLLSLLLEDNMIMIYSKLFDKNFDFIMKKWQLGHDEDEFNVDEDEFNVD